ncbi:MAG: hydrogenase expression/formation protein HypE [Synergistetes bacterium]|nr:hydrogenase expression/formation protein HypE [Synergistota bacterium]
MITLDHGSGGKLSRELIEKILMPELSNPILSQLGDSAILDIASTKIAFTTDSHTVSPLFFPGGDIGKLSVTGTINDLAMVGATPLYLSLSLIMEEGFSEELLKEIVKSISSTAKENDVRIVTGDTKVVEKEKVDKIFINTAGIGIIPQSTDIGPHKIRHKDRIILSGSLGEHSITLMVLRNEMELPKGLKSDCASLYPLVRTLTSKIKDIHAMRDITRGGLGTVLNEFVADASFGIEIEESKIPIQPDVKAYCDILGFDPLYLANEGKLVLFAAPDVADEIVSIMRKHPLGKDAAVIGEVTESHPGIVAMKTSIGGKRIVDSLVGEQLPRIC